MTKALQINRREALGFWLNEMGLTNEAAEIGCAFGGFARIVLAQWKGKTYHMIDPWISQDVKVYKETQSSPEVYEHWYNACVALAGEDSRVRVIRDFSVPASEKFKDGQLDFAYIDANHAYAPVISDMDAWWPKIRIGGLMGGHDCYTATEGGHFCEVDQAVKRWAEQHGKPYYVCPCTSWFIVKDSP